MFQKFSHREHDKILILVAQQYSESISESEAAEVHEHLRCCAACRDTAEEYKALVDYGRAIPKYPDQPDPESLWNHDEQKLMLFARLHAEQENAPRRKVIALRNRLASVPTALPWVTVGLLIITSSVLVGYRFGISAERTHPGGSSVPSGPTTLGATHINNDMVVQAELQQARKRVAVTDHMAKELQSTVANLESQTGELKSRISELTARDSKSAELQQSTQREKEDLTSKLAVMEKLLSTTRQQLQEVRDQLSTDLLRAANAEFRMQQMSTELRDKDEIISRQRQYLESDRDIRELMGARQLHIADVVDTDPNGKNRAPFGRVFYTKGKSLIFYGFDLDQQPGVRNASVFHAWGHSDSNSHKPVSLGIFYMDNETNHRWVLRANDSELLSQLDAVFVTVEKSANSKHPSEKPFLYTYLRKGEPNHP